MVVLAGLGWFYLAPTQIGGSTSYVITHGISMEPLIHADDLVLVRPADNYRVGQVVAYHSTLLHTVVLHRIIRIDGGHYFFKGDNNNFIDPTHPTRALLIGTMWLHIAHGGALVTLLHQPWFAALLFGAVAMFVLFGGGQKRRRRDRGRRHDSGSRRARSLPPVTSFTPHSVSRASDRQLFGACIAGALVFAVLTVVAFVRPTHNTLTVRQPYTQTLRFGYHASVPPSPVYPSGTVRTGDPVYIQLVHQLTVTAAYRLTTTAPYRLHGTIGIRATLSNTSGWSRSFWLARPTPFVGASARTSALIDLPRFQSLANRISAQIGGADGGSYSLAVTPRVQDRRNDRGPADVDFLQPDAEPWRRRDATAERQLRDRSNRARVAAPQRPALYTAPRERRLPSTAQSTRLPQCRWESCAGWHLWRFSSAPGARG